METDKLSTIAAPADWTTDPDWLSELVERASDTLFEFANEYCTKVYSCDGQACVIVSFPRRVKDSPNDFNVAVYDIDAARITWAPLAMCVVGSGGIFERECRDSEVQDFEFETVMRSRVADEAANIAAILFPE